MWTFVSLKSHSTYGPIGGFELQARAEKMPQMHSKQRAHLSPPICGIWVLEAPAVLLRTMMFWHFVIEQSSPVFFSRFVH